MRLQVQCGQTSRSVAAGIYVLDQLSMTGKWYIEVVMVPHARSFRGAVGEKLFYGRERILSPLTVCKRLSRGWKYSSQTDQHVPLIWSESHWKCKRCLEETYCSSAISSYKQEYPHPCNKGGMGKLALLATESCSEYATPCCKLSWITWSPHPLLIRHWHLLIQNSIQMSIQILFCLSTIFPNV